MIRSMTAFAYRESTTDQGMLSLEIRSVNHRYLDISLRLPEEFRNQENTLRDFILSRVKRGKIELTLRFTPLFNTENAIQVNEELAKSLIVACRQIEAIAGNTEALKAVDILRWPGVTQEARPNLEHLHQQVRALVLEALNDLVSTRSREGQRLAEFIYARCDQIAEISVRIRKRRPIIIQQLRDKILQRLEELNIHPDNNRLEQELVLLAQRLDVEEELDRIMAHLDEINEVLERKEPIGRRLDFLMQELNREANTLSAKSNDTETTQATVDLKVLIEQLREQVQNIE
ncbi:YicC/YloC family endoribonuclease [Thiofilum flexile]|uniref:YicC/YloC family endoribonuclease n=1 Tax=Thiofilum flexile TaxID=125627 RepID=UPI000367967E|nr:YicC/YloC family endoribonuclease [Thiofilum flexile]